MIVLLIPLSPLIVSFYQCSFRKTARAFLTLLPQNWCKVENLAKFLSKQLEDFGRVYEYATDESGKLQVLGGGAFGTVYKGRSKREGGRSVAIKVPNYVSNMKEAKKAVEGGEEEIRIWSKLSSPFILELYDYYVLTIPGTNLPGLCLVTPIAKDGTLMKRINDFEFNDDAGLPQDEAWLASNQIMLAGTLQESIMLQ